MAHTMNGEENGEEIMHISATILKKKKKKSFINTLRKTIITYSEHRCVKRLPLKSDVKIREESEVGAEEQK